MATPALQLQNISATIRAYNAGSLRVNTFNASGTVLNVSTGYTLALASAIPNSNQNALASPIDLSSDVTAAFDATGFTLSWTAAQATTIAEALPTAQAVMDIGISNDSGTTKSTAGRASLSVDQTSAAMGG